MTLTMAATARDSPTALAIAVAVSFDRPLIAVAARAPRAVWLPPEWGPADAVSGAGLRGTSGRGAADAGGGDGRARG